MNISPISFGKTYKVVGENQKAVAYRIANLVSGYRATNDKEAQVQEDLLTIFDDSTLRYPARVLDINNGKDVFIVSGEEAKKIHELEKDRMFHVNQAYKNYGDDKNLVGVVVDSENDRFEALAGEFADSTQVGTISAKYSTRYNRIKSFNINA